jgi:hypothetical protein
MILTPLLVIAACCLGFTFAVFLLQHRFHAVSPQRVRIPAGDERPNPKLG